MTLTKQEAFALCIVAGLILPVVIAGFAFSTIVERPPHNEQPLPKPLDTSELLLSADAASKAFGDAPISLFKANTMVVVGAHLQGPEADAELNKILNEYAIFKLEQIKETNK